MPPLLRAGLTFDYLKKTLYLEIMFSSNTKKVRSRNLILLHFKHKYLHRT